MEDRMEEVLQRVQFKFASIIGELCSEPLVLSQFAVWVDMRISEYKLKGSISLDCSGESPDPIWLKGITYALTQKLKQAQKEAANVLSQGKSVGLDRIRRPRAGGGQPSLVRNNTPGYSSDNQDIIIKGEPGEESDVFPVDLYANSEKVTEMPIVGAKRKLPSSASVPQDSSVFVSLDTSSKINQPVHKTTRLSSAETQPSDPDPHPEHTSLLSIIGVDHSGQDCGELTLQETDTEDISIILDSSSLPDVLSMQQGDNSHLQPSSVNNTSYGPSSAGGSPNLDKRKHVSRTHKVPQGKVVYRSQVPATVAKTRGHVAMFQNWLKNQPSPELRKMEDIPPVQLDTYLAAFFRTVKRHTGEDYGPSSFKSLRQSLERHLRDLDYPYSITRSEEFFVSKQVYKERMRFFKAHLHNTHSDQGDKES